MTYTAVIASLQSQSFLPGCLASLQAQTVPPAETIVVDAGSRDTSVGIAEAAGARTIVTANRGLGALYNAGIRAATSPFAFCINADVVVEETCAARLLAVMGGDRLAAAPTQLAWDESAVHRGCISLCRGSLTRQVFPGLHLETGVTAVTTCRTAAFDGGAVLLHREAMLALGGFDERFFLDFEDLDLCLRAHYAGLTTVYVPDAVVRHYVGASTTARQMPVRLRAGHRNVMRIAVTSFPPRELALVLIGELLRAPRHPTLVLPALGDTLRDLPRLVAERRRRRPTRERFDELLLLGQVGSHPR